MFDMDIPVSDMRMVAVTTDYAQYIYVDYDSNHFVNNATRSIQTRINRQCLGEPRQSKVKTGI